MNEPTNDLQEIHRRSTEAVQSALGGIAFFAGAAVFLLVINFIVPVLPEKRTPFGVAISVLLLFAIVSWFVAFMRAEPEKTLDERILDAEVKKNAALLAFANLKAKRGPE